MVDVFPKAEWEEDEAPQWSLIEGDAMREMPEFSPELFDAIITDPPYGMGFESFHRNEIPTFGKIPNDTMGQPFVWWMWSAYRVLKPGGAVLCFCNWQNDEAYKLALGWAGFTVKSQVIWNRGNHGMGDLDTTFGPMHDIIWYATKGKGRFYSNRPLSVIHSMRPTGAQLRHPNEKPLPLMRHLIRCVTPPGGMILDPFAGSGSTGIAAVMEKRECVMIELLKYNCDIIRGRMRGVQTAFDVEFTEETTK